METISEGMLRHAMETISEGMLRHAIKDRQEIHGLETECKRLLRRSIEDHQKIRELETDCERLLRRSIEDHQKIRELETDCERLLRRSIENQIIQTVEFLPKEPWIKDHQKIPEVIHNAETSKEKMIVEKQEVYLNYRRSFHGTKLLKSSLSLAPFFWPCAGGTGHGSGQPEHQDHSEIYSSTLNVVSNCPSRGEYMQRSLAKCADVCGSYMQDGNCAYHCMRDSSKTNLVEFCAKPKPLFNYCPEYDPVDQTIQKDLATLCNSTFSRNYYISSDIYFCDPDNCLQLYESSVRSGATTLMNETTETNGGNSQEWFLLLLVVLAALILAIIIGCILLRVFVKRGIFSARTHKMTKKRNQNEKQIGYTERMITDQM